MLYLIIIGILCNKFCKPNAKKQKEHINSINKIDIIGDKVSYIIIILIISIIYLVKN